MSIDDSALRSSLVREARRLQPLDLVSGTSGNLSVRVDGGMLITPSGIAYEMLQPEDMVFVNDRGQWQHALDPSSEWQMHLAVYQAREEASAVVHAHPTYSTVLAIRGMEIPALHYMIAAAGGAPVRCAPYHTYGTEALSQAAVKAMEGRKACLLANHGILCFEANLAKAMWLAVELETLARQYVMSLLLGGPNLLPDAEIETVVGKFSRYGLKAKS